MNEIDLDAYCICSCCFASIFVHTEKSNIYQPEDKLNPWGRDGIVEEPPVHVYYAYLKPT